MLSSFLYFFIIINLVLASKSRPKQCLRYSNHDIFSETCPAQLPINFSAALFPDPAVISGLSKEVRLDEQKKVNEPTSTHITDSLLDDTNSSKFPHEDQQPKPLVSFEEWQKKVLQENEKDRRHKRKTTEKGPTSGLKRQQMVDSIDGGFSDDFGSMFEELIGKKEKKPNVYDEGEYIAPSKAGDVNSNKKVQQVAAVRMKSLKERFNYASTDCAATVRKANKEAKGAQTILYESKDQYLLNKCSADKFVIINLCEQIVVDTIVMANFEFFSSTFKDFRVYASSKYPTQDWRLLGQWQARNTRDLQVFKVPDSGFVEYMKIEFITHYGNEYYCPLSLVRVHGMSMMEYYTTVESQGDDPIIEEEHLWPAEVREQLIQPQFDVTNTSESFPIKVEQEEEDIKQLIPPINYDTVVDIPLKPVVEIHTTESGSSMETIDTATTTTTTTTVKEPISLELELIESLLIDELVVPTSSNSLGSMDTETFGIDLSSSSSSLTNDETSATKEEININDTHSSIGTESKDEIKITQNKTVPIDISSNMNSTYNTTTSSATTPSMETSSTKISSTKESSAKTSSTTTSTASTTTTTTTSTALTEESRLAHQHPPPKVAIPTNYAKEGSTQESIYKTIMKRLNGLEGNMTLSLRYLDDQNKNLNDVLNDRERKHQAQLIQLIGHLNETASLRIDNMKRRYEQWYEDLKDQTDSDMREMSAKINILADQLSFERRVSLFQLVIMIGLFVFMALSRGTFSTLSPVMAAQQEERKRRESIDQPPSKETMESIINTEKPKIEIPKKPNNPRRHSDYPYHIMGESEIHKNDTPNTTVYSSLGIELQNDVLQRKLDELSQQQMEQNVPLLNKVSRKTSLENLRPKDETTIKNRKRSCTSPSSS